MSIAGTNLRFDASGSGLIGLIRVSIAAVGLLLATAAPAALWMEEGFTGAPGSYLAGTEPWAGDSGASLQIVSGNLSLAGVPPTVVPGNMLQVAGGAETLDDYRSFTSTPVTSGTVYFSALLNCTSLPTNRQFVVALTQSGTTQANAPDDPLDLYLVGLTNASGYRLAVRHTGSDTATASAVLAVNTTHFIVLKYDFSVGRGSLYIDPPAGGLEPTRPDASTESDDGGGQNPADLQQVIFEASPGNQGTVLFDTLRIGQLWWDVVQVHTAAIGPASLTNCLGGPATFSVTAAGTAPFSYQWRTNGVPVPDATNDVYALANPGPADTLSVYDVVVNDQLGTVTSRLATLTLDTILPAISIQSTNPVIQGPVSNATFNVTATGDAPLNYQWRVNGASINGATRRAYTLFNPRPGTVSNAYDVVVSNPCGSTTSAPAHPVFPPPGVAVSGPQDQVACAGSAVTFSVSTLAGTPPFSYQWRTYGTVISGATTTSYTIPSTGPGDAPGAYAVIVNDAFGATTSQVANLTLSTIPPAIVTAPTNVILCAPVTNATFMVGVTGDAPLSFQWRTNGIAVTGATASSYTVTNPTAGDAFIAFDVVIANPCGTLTSAPPVQILFPHPFFGCGASPGFFGGMNLATTNVPGMVLYAWSSADLSVPVSSWTLEGQLAEQPLNDGSGNDYYEINVNPLASPVYYIIGTTTVGPYVTPAPVQWITTDALGNQTLSSANLNLGADGSLSFPLHPFYGCGASPGFFGGMNLATTNAPGVTIYAWSSADLTQSITNWTLEGQLAEQPLNDGSGNSYYEINVIPLASLVYYVVGPTNVGPYAAPVPVQWITTDALGNYSFSVTNLAIDATGVLGFLSLPVLTIQPMAQTVAAGKTASFSVAASGAPPLTYQWYFNSSTALAAGTDTTLTLAGITPNQAGTYSVVVANGSGSVTSSPAVLMVLPQPTLSLQRVANGYQLRAGGMAGDVVWVQATTNLAPPINWVTLGTNVIDLSGAAQFTDTNLTPRCFYRLGFPAAAPSSPVILQSPLGRTVMTGKPASFNVMAAGAPPLSYQWYFNGSNALPGGTNASLQVVTTNGGGYSVVITNNYGSATSSAANLVLVPPPLLSMRAVTNGLQLSGAGVTGDTYLVQMATGLTPPVTWVTLSTNVVGVNGLVRFTDTSATIHSNRFYRLLFP